MVGLECKSGRNRERACTRNLRKRPPEREDCRVRAASDLAPLSTLRFTMLADTTRFFCTSFGMSSVGTVVLGQILLLRFTWCAQKDHAGKHCKKRPARVIICRKRRPINMANGNSLGYRRLDDCCGTSFRINSAIHSLCLLPFQPFEIFTIQCRKLRRTQRHLS